MLVSIYSRTPSCLRIVSMNPNEPTATDDLIEFTKCFLHSWFATNLVTRGEQVCGIEAHAQPLWLAHVCNDVREMLESMTDARTLTGCNLKRDFRPHFWNFP